MSGASFAKTRLTSLACRKPGTCWRRWKPEYKDLLREAQRAAPTQRIAEVLRRLLEEDVPIRNMRLILEAILEWAPREQDNIALAGQVRVALKRQICFRVARGEKVIPALIVERQAEEALRKAGQSGQMPDAEFAANFSEAFRAATGSVAGGIPANVIVLVSAELRRTVWTMLRKAGLQYPVLSFPGDRARLHGAALGDDRCSAAKDRNLLAAISSVKRFAEAGPGGPQAS